MMKYEALWLGTWPPLTGEASASARPKTASDLTVREHILLFCVASRTD
jgi:hypothetical protein